MPTVADRVRAGRFVSAELWPQRSPESEGAPEAAGVDLASLSPAFIAITCGAGGSTPTTNRAAATLEVCANLGWDPARTP